VQLDERDLHERYQRTGDQSAREQLAEHYLPLARSLALRYRGGSESVDDLYQVACLGMLKALERFDPARGASFQAFAVPTVLGELKRHFRDRVLPIHLPRGVKERALEINRATEALIGELDRPPTVSELAARLEISEEEVLEGMRALEASRTVSLDVPVGGEEGDSPATVDTVGTADPGFENAESRVALQRAMGNLEEREQTCLKLRFGADMTQEEIASEVGVSQVHVSRILRRALNRLRSEVGLQGYQHAA
jgi:RNA polymerase sigma-B factor